MQGNQSIQVNRGSLPKDGGERSKRMEEHFWGDDFRKPQRSWKQHRKTRYR